ncbi:MAG: hypothetical protein IT555_16360 [Acetobacteraceae bacterium]|nr:hypothetical protein [Acetobacteraceae bacterium]
MLTIAARFTLILAGLRAVVAAFIAQRDPNPGVVWLGTRAFIPVQPPPGPAPIPPAIWTLAWTRLGRMAQRFERLYLRWKSATLPIARPPRPARPPTMRAPTMRPPTMRLPTRRAWLVVPLRHHGAAYACQLEVLLADPEFPAFIAAAPQAGRILRPLCRMLGLTPPAPLRLPPRPPRRYTPRARPAPAEKPPREPPREPSPRQIRAALRRPRLPPILFPTRRHPAGS